MKMWSGTLGRAVPADQPEAIPSRLALLVGVGMLCVGIPLWVTGGIDVVTLDPLTAALSLVAMLYPAVRLSQMLASGRRQWLTFMFWAFSYVWIGLAGWAQTASRQNPYLLTFSEDSLQGSAILALVGMAAFDIGARLGDHQQRVPQSIRIIQPKRVTALGVLTIVATPILIQQWGGWQTLLLTRSERSQGSSALGFSMAQGGVLAALTLALPLVASVSTISLLRSNPTLRRKPFWWMMVIALTSMALFVNNPVSSPRYVAGTVILALVFSTGLAQTSRGFRLAGAGILGALVVLFPYADLFRSAAAQVVARPLSYFLVAKGDYDSATQMVNVIDYRSEVGGTDGIQVLSAILFFVPRSLWPGKSEGAGALLASYRNYDNLNASSPLWVEGYLDAGLIGAVLLLAVAGYAARSLELINRISTPGLVSYATVAVPMAAAFSLLVYRGSLLTAVGPLASLLLLPMLMSRREELGRGHNQRAPSRSVSDL